MKKSTRDAYGEALVELAEKNAKVVVLDADLSSSTRTSLFAARFPDRFFDMGVAEQNLYGVAAGLAISGKIPFASAFAVFATERAYNQIRQSIAYPALCVRIAASHSGLTAAGDGGSHQTLIDISLMRALPNMTVIVPADATQTRKAVLAAADIEGPVYLRLGKSEVPVLFDDHWIFETGRVVTLREGVDVTVFVTGILLSQAIEASSIVAKEGLEVQLVNVHTIKPIDRHGIVHAVERTRCAITVEEHSVIGGLGSAIAEVLGEMYPIPLEMVGVKDCFGESGDETSLFAKHGLTPEGIAQAIRRVAGRRKRE
jgi:transketolase